MGWREFAGLLAVLAFTQSAGCAHPSPAATRPAHSIATTKPSEDEDIAALTAALQQKFGPHVHHDRSTLSLPPLKTPTEADRFIATSAGTAPQATLWILSPDATAAYIKSVGSHHGDLYDKSLWNGRIYVLRGNYYRFRRLVEQCVEETNCPVVATIVAGPDGLDLQLKNRLKHAVGIPQLLPDAPVETPGYNVWSDKFFWEGGTHHSAELVHLPPGGRQVWPMHIEIAPGTDAKIDARYEVTEKMAVEMGMSDTSLVAPSVRVHCDHAGRYTVTPWKPTALSATESARSQRLSAFAVNWSADVMNRLALAADTSPRSAIVRDAAGHIDHMRFVLLTTSGGIPFGVRMDVSREGDLHGLAIAQTMDPIKWDGREAERAYHVPGSDWILRAVTDAGVSPQVQSAIDACFSAFLHADVDRTH